MSKGCGQRARFNTGIRLRQLFFPFIKDTLESSLRSKLHVELKTLPAKPEEFIEILLVGCGERPHFEEAKVLLQKTIKMTEENWEHLKGNSSANTNAEMMQPIDLDDSIEELSSDGDTEDIAKENKKNLSKTVVVCGSNGTDGLLPVIMDTSGGPVSTGNDFPGAELTKGKVNEKNLLSCNESIGDSSDSTSPSPTTTSGGARTSGEDFILLKSRSKEASQNDTIVLDDETIVISSGSDSEEDILIDKVVQAVPHTPISKKKKKKKKKSLSKVIGPTKTLTQPLISNGKKRKSNENVDLDQRISKIGKIIEQSDVTTSRKPVGGLHISSLHKERTKGKQRNKNSASKGSIPSTSPKHNFANNVISSSNQTEKKTGLRPVVIDANNVSRDGKRFQFKKLETCIKYFRDRNHKVIAFLPRHMLGVVQDHAEKARMWTLEEEKVVCFTPSRKMPDGKSMAAYDDRFIVQAATELGGVIVSNDNFRDIMTENEQWKETIEKRLLMFTWVGDMLMFPNDPLGRGGPHLEEFLRFPEEGE